MDRTVKLHQKEFDVLPEAWSKLNDAYGLVTATTSALQQYPDLDRMTDPHLEEFLNDCPLIVKRMKFGDPLNAQTITQKRSLFHRMSQCREACRELHIFLRRGGIFIPEPTKSKFSEIDKLVYGALVEHEINERDEVRPRLRTSLKKLSDQGEQLIEDSRRRDPRTTVEL